jgi:DNA polymerase-3 subunit beta
VNGSGSFMLTKAQLAAGLRRCSACVSSDTSRYILNAVAIHLFASGTVAFVATDGRRLAELPVTVNLDHVPNLADKAPRVILVPRQTLKLLDALVSDEDRMDESISVRFDSQRAEFRSGDQTILTKQLEGNYANYEQVIPASYQHSHAVDRAELSRFLSALSTFANDKVSGVLIQPAENGSGRIQFSLVNPESGEGRTTLECDPPCRDLKPVTLNIDYLRSFLAVHPTDRVTLSFNDPADAVGGNTVPPDGRMVLMPMRTQ